MRQFLEGLRRCRRGVTAIEYGLIAGLISVAVIVVVGTIGGQTGGMWRNISARFPTVLG